MAIPVIKLAWTDSIFAHFPKAMLEPPQQQQIWEVTGCLSTDWWFS
jgi:hypothetical protein